MRFFGDPHATPQQTRDWVAGSVIAPRSRTREFSLLRDGEVIGKAGIWSAPEIGFLLRRDQWRQGLMREALTALLPHFFDTMTLPRITADADPRNLACLHLLEGLGFRETHRARHTIMIGGQWCDSVYLALPAPSA